MYFKLCLRKETSFKSGKEIVPLHSLLKPSFWRVVQIQNFHNNKPLPPNSIKPNSF
jgi:hypothetical protein